MLLLLRCKYEKGKTGLRNVRRKLSIVKRVCYDTYDTKCRQGVEAGVGVGRDHDLVSSSDFSEMRGLSVGYCKEKCLLSLLRYLLSTNLSTGSPWCRAFEILSEDFRCLAETLISSSCSSFLRDSPRKIRPTLACVNADSLRAALFSNLMAND